MLRLCTALFPLLLLMNAPAAAEPDEPYRQRLEELERRVAAAEEEANAPDDSIIKWHLAGYTDVNFVYDARDSVNAQTSFSSAAFNPIFHFQYGEKLMFEAELEIDVDEEGSTENVLEYSNVNYFLTDDLILVMGRFISPIGAFQERLHPSWINKLPTAPAGFAHGGVAPLSETGVQLRGMQSTSAGRINYAVFAGNGPRVGHHGPELEGFGADGDDDKAFGGRFGYLPIRNVEIGVSYMTADEVAPESAPAGPAATPGEYTLTGADFAWTGGPWELRGEYIDSELTEFVGAPHHGATANEVIPATDFEAWYVQGSHRFNNWEPVVRVSEYTASGFDEFVEGAFSEQTIGLNYVAAPSLIFKFAIQSRDFDDPGTEDGERFQFQIAYGF